MASGRSFTPFEESSAVLGYFVRDWLCGSFICQERHLEENICGEHSIAQQCQASESWDRKG